MCQSCEPWLTFANQKRTGWRSDRHTQISLLIPLCLKQICWPTTAVSYTSIFPVSHLQVCLIVFITSWKDLAQVRRIDRQPSQSLNLLASAKVRQINKLEVESVTISTKRNDIWWVACIPEFHIPVSLWLKDMGFMKIVIGKGNIWFVGIDLVVCPSSCSFYIVDREQEITKQSHSLKMLLQKSFFVCFVLFRFFNWPHPLMII